jgi:hypothetical protein
VMFRAVSAFEHPARSGAHGFRSHRRRLLLALCKFFGLGLTLVLQDHDRRTPAARFRGSILEGKNQRVSLQNATHDIALNACSTAVNDSQFFQAGLPALLKIFLDDARDIFGSEGMEIDEILDRKNNRFDKRRLSIRIRGF